MARGGDDESVCGIGVELPRQAYARDGNRGFDWQHVDALGAQGRVYPLADVLFQAQAASFSQERDFPRRNGRNAYAIRAMRLLDCSRGFRAEPSIAVNSPDQHMGIQKDQCSAAQSEGDAAGSRGFS